MSIIQRDSSYIHWGLVAPLHGGGGVSRAFISWNLVYIRFNGPVGGRVMGKAWRALRYPPWHQVALCSSLARNEK